MLLQTSEQIDDYRERCMSPTLLREALATGGIFLLNGGPGVGKTTAAMATAVESLATGQFDKIVVAVGQRRLIALYLEAFARAGADMSTIVVYPDLEIGSVCKGKYDDKLQNWTDRGLSALVRDRICDVCPDLKVCRFANRHKMKLFKDAKILIVTEQLLRLKGNTLLNMGCGPKTLTIIDECAGADDGFVKQIKANELKVESHVAAMAGSPDLSDLLFRLLHQPLEHHDTDRAEKDLYRYRIALETRGEQSPGFRYISGSAIAYAKKPLWYESGTYATVQRPTYPGTVWLLGGYLNPEYVAWRYGFDQVKIIAPRAIARFTGTRVININTPLGAAGLLWQNMPGLVNFATDLLIDRIGKGLTTALLMRRDLNLKRADGQPDPKSQYMTNAIHAISHEMNRRGYGHVVFRRPGEELPDVPVPTIVPIITYGMAGVNSYEHYECLMAFHAYHVDAKMLADKAYDDLPPSKRPTLKFAQGNVRRLNWIHAPGVSPELRQRAELMLERTEVDVTLQALHRVRPGLHPRLIICNMRCDPTPYLGPVETAKNLTMVRITLGLPLDTRVTRRKQLAVQLRTLVAQGVSLTAAAKKLDFSRRTATSLRKEYGVDWVLTNLGHTKVPQSAQN